MNERKKNPKKTSTSFFSPSFSARQTNATLLTPQRERQTQRHLRETRFLVRKKVFFCFLKR